MIKRGELNTEQQNLNSLNIDNLNVREILTTINNEDERILIAIKEAIPQIEKAVTFTINSIRKGGRVFYVGAGTSGRLGILDASEIPPTFSVPDNIFIGLIAGGDRALRESIEGAEDNTENAIKDLQPFKLKKNDTLIGISCSGAASYVISAIEYAKKHNSSTVYIVTNPTPYFTTNVDVLIHANTGAEVITGSTRMKGGTATKMILNMISTATMIKLGKVYNNLMVDLMAVNEKLIDRGIRIIIKLTEVDYKEAKRRLSLAENSVKVALVMYFKECNITEARKSLIDAEGFLHKVIDNI